MTSLIDIESAIKQLPENEIRKLLQRLQAYLDEMWDEQMETDLAVGKLDSLIAKAEADTKNLWKHNRIQWINILIYVSVMASCYVYAWIIAPKILKIFIPSII